MFLLVTRREPDMPSGLQNESSNTQIKQYKQSGLVLRGCWRFDFGHVPSLANERDVGLRACELVGRCHRLGAGEFVGLGAATVRRAYSSAFLSNAPTEAS